MTSSPIEPIDYEEAYRSFKLEDLAATLHGSLEHGVNACVECCDRWADTGAVALDWENAAGERASFTFADMRERAARCASWLTSLGIKPGDVVAGMLPRIPELLALILGTWRAGAIYQPLFTAFGPQAVQSRFKTSDARLVVTDAANRPKLDSVEACPRVAVVAKAADIREGDIDFRAALVDQPATFEPVMRHGDDLFLMLSTSGTTGTPKGVPVPLKAMLSFLAYNRDAIGLQPDDKFWNIADPGWAYGLYYAVVGPLILGHATTFFDGPFTAATTYDIIARHGITNLAGSPTAFRLLLGAGPEAAAAVKGKLRVVSSAGEPLNPEVIRWFAEHLEAPIYDHYGQSENGMMVNNHHHLRHKVHPGSSGLPMPGFRVVVLDDEGRELGPGKPGVLSLDLARSPLHWFKGYWKRDTPAIAGGYYRTGDTVQLEEDGRFTFVGRDDDVITSSGYRIGPFEVESALVEHPAVQEAGVIGKPDPERTEIVKAFVVTRPGVETGPELAEALRKHVRQRLSAHAYPREIVFVKELPKTPSGKIQRFVLRERARGGGSATS